MRLSSDHKAFIVQRLACFDTPTEVQAAFRERFGKEVSTSHIVYYDPESAQGGKELAQDWKDLFAATREHFVSDTSSIPIAQKAVRLRRLDRMSANAEERRNYPLAASLIEQAAKECGDAYTNRKLLDVTSKGEQVYTGVVFTAPGSTKEPPD